MAFLSISPRMRTKAAAAAAALFLLVHSVPSAAQEESRLRLNEQTIKAGLVYNFLKYTSWPDGSAPQKSGHLTVCLFGLSPQDSYLSPLQGQSAQQVPIDLIRKDDAADTGKCNMVFVDSESDDKSKLPDLLGFLKDQHILTVSDMENFTRMGGMVELAMADKRITLLVNRKSVNRAGLTIQGRLLNLAKQDSD
jgi:hypothetical protein